MGAFILRRLCRAIFVFFGVSLIVFLCLRVSGDPAELILPLGAKPESIEALRHSLGLDRPLPEQYGRLILNALRLDFGNSIYYRQSVRVLIFKRLPKSIILSFAAIVLAMLIAIPLGVLAGYKRQSSVDVLSTGIALFGQSIPSFWLGIMLIIIFATRIKGLPTGGSTGLQSLILPTLTLTMVPLARFTRFIRSGVIDTLSQDYVRTARAKGVKESRVLLKHVLKNSIRPAITDMGMTFGRLIGGAIITETVFSWPGVGRLLMDGITNRDFPVVEGTIIIIAMIFVFINLIIDISYIFLDPRVTL